MLYYTQKVDFVYSTQMHIRGNIWLDTSHIVCINCQHFSNELTTLLTVTPMAYCYNGSMVGILSLLCVCLFVQIQISRRRKKDSGVKLRMLVRLLSRMNFSHFGELWPRGDSPRSLNTRQMRVLYGGICVVLMHLSKETRLV